MSAYLVYFLFAIAVCSIVVALYDMAFRTQPLPLAFSLLGLVSAVLLPCGWGAYFQ